ncbi:MAG: TIGR03905 family TSCPD domain-containing protein [Prevotella sp.]|nr:TIGR03905 family TSCPD domain-containing protein [Prevotella sp.]
MKHYEYQTSGVCSKAIVFDLDEQQQVHNIQFIGGCPGNTTGVSLLSEGHDAQKLISMLKDVKCGYKNTSCPAQFALALSQAMKEEI